MKKLFFILLLLISLSAAANYDNPYKVTVDDYGNYYLADTLDHSVKKILKDGTTLTLRQDFNYPQAVAVDQNHNLYVLDTGNNKLKKFQDNNNEFTFLGELPLKLRYPRDIAISPESNFLYILDSGNNKIMRINIGGKKDNVDLIFGEGLNAPYGLDVDPYGNLYVADTGNHRIVKYSADGKLILSFGREGSQTGELLLPKDIAVGYSGQIIVADSGNDRLQRYSENGIFIGIVNSEKKELRDIRGLAIDKQNGKLYISSAGERSVINILDLGFKIKKFTLENKYFSPNNDGNKDELVFKVELLQPSDLSLEILQNNKIIKKIRGPKKAENFQKITWQPEKKELRDGLYSFRFFCQDPLLQKEPFVINGEFIIDTVPPKIKESFVSPNVFAPKTYSQNEYISFIGNFNEEVKMIAEIYIGKENTFYSELFSDNNYAKDQKIIWQGTNKYLEIKNNTYFYELYGEDEAGNRSRSKSGSFVINYEHPLIIKAALTANLVPRNSSSVLNLGLLQESNTTISLLKLSGVTVKNIYTGQLKAGEHQFKIDLQNIPDGDYALLVKAKKGSLEDTYYNALVVDSTPPQIKELAVSKKELWGGGLDKSIIRFFIDEPATCNIQLKNKANESIWKLVEKQKLAAGKEFIYTFRGTDISERYLPAGEYLLTITVTDALNNQSQETTTIKVSTEPPQISNLKLSSDILGLYGYGSLKAVQFKYDLHGSLDDLFVTLKIFKDGAVVKTLADRQRRIRGENYDYWYASEELSDGVYQYELLAEDEFKHHVLKNGTLYVIGKKPQLNGLTQSTPVISPAIKNGKDDTLVFNFTSVISNTLILKKIQDLTTSSNAIDPTKVTVKLEIQNLFTIESHTAVGSNQFVWDGKDDKNKYIKDGNYEYTLYLLDITGAEAPKITGNIRIGNSEDKVDLYELAYYDPHNAGQYNHFYGTNPLTVKYTMRPFDFQQNMQPYIYNAAGTLIKTLTASTYSGPQVYSAIWHGKDEYGLLVPPGNYYLALRITDEIGNNSLLTTANNNTPIIPCVFTEKLTSTQLIINNIPDSSAPFNNYTGSPTITLNFGIDYFPVSQNIYPSIYNDNLKIKTLPPIEFSGSGNYLTLWDGTTDSGALVDNDTFYFGLNIIDVAGNIVDYPPASNKLPHFTYENEITAAEISGDTYLFSLIDELGSAVIYYQEGVKVPLQIINKSDTLLNTSTIATNKISNPLSNLPFSQTLNVSIAISGNYQPDSTFLEVDGIKLTAPFTQLFAANYGGDFKLQAAANNIDDEVTITYDLNYNEYNYQKNKIKSSNLINWSESEPVTQKTPWSYPQSVTLNCYGIEHQLRVEGGTLYYKRSNGTTYTADIALTQNSNILDPVLAIYSDELYALWGDARPGHGNIYLQKIPEKFYPAEKDSYGNIGMYSLGAGTAANNYSIGEQHFNASALNIMLISPKDAEIIYEKTPYFIWQAPDWAVKTSTNYDLDISPDNFSFNDADDFTLNLTPGQISFSGTGNEVITYKLPNSYALETGPYFWRVAAKDAASEPARATSNISSFQLLQKLGIDNQINYPNPFKKTTTIRYQLSMDADVTIRIFTLAGQLVRTMNFNPGFEGGKASSYFDKYNDVVFDAKNDLGQKIVNGAYLYEIIAERNDKQIKARGKMIKWE